MRSLFKLTALLSKPSSAEKTPPSERSGDAKDVHPEHHSSNGPVIRDVIIGLADGLTVPFALTAGLSSLNSSNLVITAGLAELFAGSISMGLGAWLAAVSDEEQYVAEEARERQEVAEKPEAEEEEIFEIMRAYGISREATKPMVDQLMANKEMWVKFMMDFELRIEKPDKSRAWISAGTMGMSYFIGGLIPMIPYFAMPNVTHALFISIAITVSILVAFGYLKARFTRLTQKASLRSAVQTLSVGVCAAAASYGIVKGVNSARGNP